MPPPRRMNFLQKLHCRGMAPIRPCAIPLAQVRSKYLYINLKGLKFNVGIHHALYVCPRGIRIHHTLAYIWFTTHVDDGLLIYRCIVSLEDRILSNVAHLMRLSPLLRYRRCNKHLSCRAARADSPRETESSPVRLRWRATHCKHPKLWITK